LIVEYARAHETLFEISNNSISSKRISLKSNKNIEKNSRKFIHKSFVDFFVAYKFEDDIEEDYKDDFLQKAITYEVMQFMKNFEINKDKLYEWIESTKNRSFSEIE